VPRNDPDDTPDLVRQMILDSGFDAAAADRILSGPPPVRSTPVPLYDNPGKEDGPTLGGGGSTGRHTSTRGTVDGDRAR